MKEEKYTLTRICQCGHKENFTLTKLEAAFGLFGDKYWKMPCAKCDKTKADSVSHSHGHRIPVPAHAPSVTQPGAIPNTAQGRIRGHPARRPARLRSCSTPSSAHHTAGPGPTSSATPTSSTPRWRWSPIAVGCSRCPSTSGWGGGPPWPGRCCPWID